MARIKLRVYARLREQLGFKEKELDVGDLVELLKYLESLGSGDFIIAVNSELVETSKASRYLFRDGDVVDVMPPFSGG